MPEVRRTPSGKIRLECQECGAKFARSEKSLFDVECPKCGSTDIDLPGGTS